MLLPEVREAGKALYSGHAASDGGRKATAFAGCAGTEVFLYGKAEVTEEQLRRADIILGNLQSPLQLKKCENLKWIQLNNAGTEGYCEPGLLPEGAQLANATGAYEWRFRSI